MKKFILELESENQDEFKYALQEAIRQLEQGYSQGDLKNEDIESGYWKITE